MSDRFEFEEEQEQLTAALHAVRGGDIDAFGTVVSRYQRAVRAFMLARAPEPASADDMAQSTFVLAYESIGRFDASRDFGAWLFGIARNVVSQAWRQAARDTRHRDAVSTFLADRLARRAAEAGRPELDDRRVTALRRCIEQLPERWRSLVSRHYLEQQTLAQIADSVGSAVGTVGATLHRTRQRLRECIAARLAAEGPA